MPGINSWAIQKAFGGRKAPLIAKQYG